MHRAAIGSLEKFMGNGNRKETPRKDVTELALIRWVVISIVPLGVKRVKKTESKCDKSEFTG